HHFEGLLKLQIKRSEVDTAADPIQLELLGYAPKATARPVDLPGQPRELRPRAEGAGDVTLEWKSPARGSGGRVRSYLIQRREPAQAGGAFGEWHQAGLALKTGIKLAEQPRHRDLEYRILAVNHTGQSPPSNAVAVVL
ncbi:MAG: fibronectin type III domain-containing protein, partial [bacterium]|nr:fibronectin type III domain-containing protein [bacterium]